MESKGDYWSQSVPTSICERLLVSEVAYVCLWVITGV